MKTERHIILFYNVYKIHKTFQIDRYLYQKVLFLNVPLTKPKETYPRSHVEIYAVVIVSIFRFHCFKKYLRNYITALYRSLKVKNSYRIYYMYSNQIKKNKILHL